MTNNRNETLKWLNEQYITRSKFIIPEEVLKFGEPIRGVYGIFIIQSDGMKDCAYVGRTENIYSRLFKSDGHLVRLKNGTSNMTRLIDAYNNSTEIIQIKILEKVPCVYDHYNLDMQRIASRENYYIDKYQSLGQCLYQRPEGSFLLESIWIENKAKQNK